MPRKRRSPRQLLVAGFLWWKKGLTHPMSMLAARVDVAVWSCILISTAAAMMTGVMHENWSGVWVNAGSGLLQGTALRWSMHGLMYRKEIRAEEQERKAFIEIVRNGYAVKDSQRRKGEPDGNGN